MWPVSATSLDPHLPTAMKRLVSVPVAPEYSVCIVGSVWTATLDSQRRVVSPVSVIQMALKDPNVIH